jgi:hypothetical protein
MSLTLVAVYCNRDDCIYIQAGKCSNTGINIDSDGVCIEYEKEELSDNPDSERDIKE